MIFRKELRGLFFRAIGYVATPEEIQDIVSRAVRDREVCVFQLASPAGLSFFSFQNKYKDLLAVALVELGEVAKGSRSGLRSLVKKLLSLSSVLDQDHALKSEVEFFAGVIERGEMDELGGMASAILKEVNAVVEATDNRTTVMRRCVERQLEKMMSQKL